MKLFTKLAIFILFISSLQAQNNCNPTLVSIQNQVNPFHIPYDSAYNTPDPSPLLDSISNLPNMGYLISIKGHIDTATGNNLLIGADDDGIFSPLDFQRYGISPSLGDTLEITPFAYDLEQVKRFYHGIFTNSTITNAPCCVIFDLNQATSGYCNDLNAMGISDSSDILGLAEFVNAMDELLQPSTLSVTGFLNRIDEVNTYTTLLVNADCVDSIDLPFCFSIDTTSNYEYVITQTNASFLQDSGCLSYTSPSGNHVYEQSGLYLDTLTASTGLDSFLYLDLVIVEIDTSISEIPASATLELSGLVTGYDSSTTTIQWVNCSTMQDILFANGSSYTAPRSGYYGALLNIDSCAQLTSCYDIDFDSCIGYEVGFTIQQNGAFNAEFQPYINGSDSANYFEINWHWGDGLIDSSGLTTVLNHNYTANGPYEICLHVNDTTQGCFDVFCDSVQIDSLGNIFRSSNNLTVTTTPFQFDYNTSVETINLDHSFKVYPNPNDGFFYIQAEEVTDFSVEIYNLSGQLLLSQPNIHSKLSALDIRSYPKGLYLIKVVTNEGITTKKLIKSQ